MTRRRLTGRHSLRLNARVTALVDEIYDVLEGTLDEVIRERAYAAEGIERLVVAARIRDARCAVAVLAGLMRGGFDWHPAEDGHEAAAWRDVLLAAHDGDYKPEYRALVSRELDELVSLAKPGPKRQLPSGAFERLARAAGVGRWACRTWARDAKDDLRRGWNECADPQSLVRIPLALGIDAAHLASALCNGLVDLLPRNEIRELLALPLDEIRRLDEERVVALRRAASGDVENAATAVLHTATLPPNAMRLEHMVDSAFRVLDVDALRKRIATPAMTARLASPGAS
jgi:hypothetical protein